MTERIIGNQIRLPPIIGMMRCPCRGIGTGSSGFKKIDTEWYEYRL